MSNKEAKSRNEVNQDLPYIERYRLLQTNISPRLTTPPFRAFIKERLPFQLKSGQKEVVFAHALALKREWSQQFWKEKTDQLRLTERERKDVILVAPFMADQREDKNVKKTKPGEQFVYNGRIIKIMHWMKSLSPSISKIITFETHSSATQAFAALAGIPLVPISYEEELIGEISPLLRKKDFNPNKWKVVRPDVGRNLVATRIEDHFKIEGIHMSQVRNSDTLEKKAIDLSEELKLKLNGTISRSDKKGFGSKKNKKCHRGKYRKH